MKHMNACKVVLTVLGSLLLTIAVPTISSICFIDTVDAQDSAPEPLTAFPQSLLSIRTKTGQVINFKIWTADNPRREQQGLMFIRSMDPHNGMLFMFPENRPVTMWMKNTYLPLDMVFANSEGKIDYIAKDATPLSTDIIGPSTPEFAVLELNGGSCERFGIAVGDYLLHPRFSKPK